MKGAGHPIIRTLSEGMRRLKTYLRIDANGRNQHAGLTLGDNAAGEEEGIFIVLPDGVGLARHGRHVQAKVRAGYVEPVRRHSGTRFETHNVAHLPTFFN
jgi:hypothetical protein